MYPTALQALQGMHTTCIVRQARHAECLLLVSQPFLLPAAHVCPPVLQAVGPYTPLASGPKCAQTGPQVPFQSWWAKPDMCASRSTPDRLPPGTRALQRGQRFFVRDPRVTDPAKSVEGGNVINLKPFLTKYAYSIAVDVLATNAASQPAGKGSNRCACTGLAGPMAGPGHAWGCWECVWRAVARLLVQALLPGPSGPLSSRLPASAWPDHAGSCITHALNRLAVLTDVPAATAPAVDTPCPAVILTWLCSP